MPNLDDSVLYSGVDQPGQFGNEIKDEEVAELVRSQDQLLKELTPRLQDLLRGIDEEINSVMSIDRFVNAANQPEANIRAELQAAALYRGYLGMLKARFTAILDETKK